MIIIDMSHLAISNILSDYKNFKGTIDENLFKHMILVSLVGYKTKFQDQYGELVICCDSKSRSWRKEIFPHYKANRKKDESFIDWPSLYKILDSIIKDLKDYFPYKVIHVDGAEGDDCIAVCANISNKLSQKSVVVSNDKDFLQLASPYVDIYSTKLKEFKSVPNPKATLLEHIITGDSGDGIPNIRSVENTFVRGLRQLPIKKDIMRNQWVPVLLSDPTGNTYPEADWNQDMINRFKQNSVLIDFKYIPDNICKSVEDQLNSRVIGNKQLVMRYFIENRMRNLLRDIGKF